METFTSFVESIFGVYAPITVIDSTGEIIDSCVNFGYIASVLLMLLFLYFVLKTIGGVIYEWCR